MEKNNRELGERWGGWGRAGLIQVTKEGLLIRRHLPQHLGKNVLGRGKSKGPKASLVNNKEASVAEAKRGSVCGTKGTWMVRAGHGGPCRALAFSPGRKENSGGSRHGSGMI